MHAIDASLGDNDVALHAIDASLGDNDVALHATDASLRDNDARFHGEDPSPHERQASDRANASPLAQVTSLHPVAGSSILTTLGRPQTRRTVLSLVAAKVPEACVEDVVQDVLAEALKAADRSPPVREDLMSAWLTTIARRVVADFLAQRARRARYEGDIPTSRRASPGR